MRRLMIVAALAFLGVSCASARQGEFFIRAVDTNEKEIVCVVFNDNEPLLNEKNEPIKTPSLVRVPFSKKNGNFEPAKVGVKPVEMGPDGKIARGLQEGDVMPYLEDWRFLLPDDPKQQLFILRKNKTNTSN